MNSPTAVVDARTAKKKHTKPTHVNNILLIEDEPTFQLLFKKALTKEGYEVHVMDSHDAVHDLLLRGELSPDLILSDNTTYTGKHNLNGISFAAKYGATYPIILCSAEEDIVNGGKTNSQFKATLQKPVPLKHLLDTVNRVASDIPAPTIKR